jgi:hypothetical protein
MRKLIIIIVLFSSSLLCGQSRYYDTWYFGYGRGLDFSTEPPSLLHNGPTTSLEGSSLICDRWTGRPIIVCDGINIYDASGAVMPGGDSIIGSNNAVQSSLILPMPCDSTRYLVIVVDQAGYIAPPRGAHYNIVDIKERAGLGRVIERDRLISPIGNEYLTAVRHSNGRDYWLIVADSERVYSHLISPAGISNSPTASIERIPLVTRYYAGAIASNYEGTLLALSQGFDGGCVDLMGFDPMRGEFLNSRRILDPVRNHDTYGLCFSPDGSKLYYNISLGRGSELWQYDITADEHILVSDTSSPHYHRLYAYMALAPSSKIFLVTSPTTLGVIDRPNVKGMECGFQDSVINFNDGWWTMGLPNTLPGVSLSTCSAKVNTDVLSNEFVLNTQGFFASHLSRTQIYKVCDILGRVVVAGSINSMEFIDLSYLPKAIYIIRIDDQSGHEKHLRWQHD